MDVKDDELIDLYRSGSVDAMAELVEKHKKRLFGMIMKTTGRREDAEDVFQEVWFRAVSKLAGYRKGNFFGWLARIAHNVIIDRARVSRREVRLSRGPEEEGAADSGIPAVGNSAGEQMANRELGRRISEAVERLPLPQREVFVMRMYTQMSFREIAGAQGVSINTALARMQYALARLRDALKSDFEECLR